VRGWHGRIGCALAGVAWLLNWGLPGARTHILFFPLWLGYTLVVDGLVLRRTGSSLLTRSPRDFVRLFLLSAPVWWLFEIINWRTGNWQYLGGELFSHNEYIVFASVSFSTVIPAVFSTAELVGLFGWITPTTRGPRIAGSPRLRAGVFLVGWVMLGLLLAWPNIFYPCVWMSLVCIVDPINAWLGRRSILGSLDQGDWSAVAALGIGSLICGFFWEMWNFWSYPKWTYRIPFADCCHVFEMPLLGYLGYIPFGLELYAMVHLLQRRPPALRFRT
jgi:hypothetical protein